MISKGYNGWCNRETWCVHMWLMEDDRAYDRICALVDKADSIQTAVESVAYDVVINVDATPSGLYDDIKIGNNPISMHLAIVDWFAIAESFSR